MKVVKTTFTMVLATFISCVMNAQTFTLKSDDLSGQLSLKQYYNGMGFSGANQSPQLYWENPPKETVTFAVTVYDLDAPTGSGFWHWVAFNIPKDTREIKAGAGDVSKKLLPVGSIQSNTDFGIPGYNGAAPNQGPAHRYLFTVYAVNKKLDLTESTSPAFVGFNLHFSTISKASIICYGQK